MPYVRRKIVQHFVPPHELRPALEKLVREHGSLRQVAYRMEAEGRGSGWSAWMRIFQRIISGNGYYKLGLKAQLAEHVLLMAGMDPPRIPYKQQVWRVSGLVPSANSMDGWATRNWFYISRGKAVERKEKLEQQGRFLDWATTEATWTPLS